MQFWASASASYVGVAGMGSSAILRPVSVDTRQQKPVASEAGEFVESMRPAIKSPESVNCMDVI